MADFVDASAGLDWFRNRIRLADVKAIFELGKGYLQSVVEAFEQVKALLDPR